MMPILGSMRADRPPISIAPTVEPGVRWYESAFPLAVVKERDGTASLRASRSAMESVCGPLRLYSVRSISRIAYASGGASGAS